MTESSDVCGISESFQFKQQLPETAIIGIEDEFERPDGHSNQDGPFGGPTEEIQQTVLLPQTGLSKL